MPTLDVNIETQVQSTITRAALQALITASTVEKKIYHITDALGGTATIAVFSRSTNQVSYNAMNLNTGKFGMYWVAFDVFNPIIEGDQAVQSYVNNTYFPAVGNYNAVYLDLSTGTAYAWNGTTYFALSGGNVYAATVAGFPGTGATNTLYIATDTGVMYLWDGSAYQALNSIPYIPLAGTQEGNPVTGDIEVEPSQFRKIWQTSGGVLKEIEFDDSTNLNIRVTDISTGDNSYVSISSDGITLTNNEGVHQTTMSVLDGQITLGSSDPAFIGANYIADYDSQLGLTSLINQRVMKSRIWTKAGIWDADDDSTQGFEIGSLLWDTTNSILYRCTDNTATAAVWVNAIAGITTFKSTTDSAAVTGTTTVTKLRSQLIPAGTFDVGDIIRVRWRDRKTGVAGNATHSLYVHTSDTVTGASLLGFFTQTGTRLSFQGKRDLVIKSSTVTEVADNGTSLVTDDADIQTAFDNINVNWAVDQYIIFAVNPANAGDSMINSSYIIEKL